MGGDAMDMAIASATGKPDIREPKKQDDDDMRPEYDFSKAKRFHKTTKITKKQYDAGLRFMYLNYPCGTVTKTGKCEGCEIDFEDGLLAAMDIEVER